MAFTPQTFTKNGKTMVALTPGMAVDLAYNGWALQGAAPTRPRSELPASLGDLDALGALYARKGETSGANPTSTVGAYAYSAGTSAPLTIATYEGSGEITHPSVYFNADGWNGKRYWMAATPYPGSNSAYENPSIYCSDDGQTWAAPAGLTNPIAAAPASGYNADTHLVMVDGTLHCFYIRQGIPSTGAEQQLVFKTSTDGVTWSAMRTAFTADQTVSRPVSPAVLYEGGKWRTWYVDIVVGPRAIRYREATNPEGPWSAAVTCTGMSFPSGRQPWHLDAHRDGSELVLLIVDTASGNSDGGSLYRCVSRDGLAWTMDAENFMTPKAGRWDTKLYRSAFLPASVKGRRGYEVWYTSSLPAWKIGYTTVALQESRPDSQDANVNMLAAKAAMSPYVFGDTVNRADNAAAIGTADSGQTYTVSGTLGISGKAIYAPTAANNQATVTHGLTDGEFGLTSLVAGGAQWWLQVRKQDASNHIRFGWSGSQYSLEKVIGGSATVLSSVPTYIAPGAAGDRLKVTLSGTTVRAFINERQVAEATVTEVATATAMGIKSDGTTARLRNLYAKA